MKSFIIFILVLMLTTYIVIGREWQEHVQYAKENKPFGHRGVACCDYNEPTFINYVYYHYIK